jgi:hypothetical protein
MGCAASWGEGCEFEDWGCGGRVGFVEDGGIEDFV